MKLNNRRFTLFIILLFVTALCAVGSAAADTNYATNGDFSSGTTGWTIVPTYATSSSEVTSGVISTTQHDGTTGNVYRVYLTPYEDSNAKVSISQSIPATGINQISFWYTLAGTHSLSGYDYNKPEMKIYWGGELLDTIVAPIGSSTGWVHYTKSVPTSTVTGLTIQIEEYAQSATNNVRTLTALIDDIEVLSANTAPTLTGDIVANPATSSSNKAVSPATITFTAPTVGGYPTPTITWTNTANQQTATGTTASFTFQNEGTYNVICTADNGVGSAATKAITVYIDGSLPTSDFYASQTTITENDYVTFALTSTGTGESYVWTFGDGTTSTNAQPTHQYTTAGQYTVTLVVTNSIGSQTVTKNNYITVQEAGTTNVNTGSGAMYSPHTVQVSFVDRYGAPVQNMAVTVTQTGQFGVLSNILSFFGLGSGDAVVGTQTGNTGSEGSIVFAGLPNLEYTITYTYNEEQISKKLMPSETFYIITVGAGNEIITEYNPWKFSNEISEDYHTINLRLTYHEANTTSVYVWCKQDGEMLTSQTFAGNAGSLNATVANTRGVEYSWGFIAYNATGVIHEDSRKVSATGDPDSPLWSFGFENEGGIGKEWYFYIALAIMVLTGALFGAASVKQGAIVVTLFEGGIFLFVGWIPVAYAPLIALAGGLALLAIGHKEGRELGFSSIVLLIALSGAVIGLVNGSGLFGAGYATSFGMSDYSLSMEMLGDGDSIIDYAGLILTCGQTMLNMIWSILQLFVFGIPMLMQLGCPVALATLIQVAIWVTATLWVVTDLLPKIKG